MSSYTNANSSSSSSSGQSSSRYRHSLPQLEGGNKLFITDGGLETSLVYEEKMDLPCFASFPLVKTSAGILQKYYAEYLELTNKYAAKLGGIIIETATWRANRDWAEKMGYTAEDLVDINQQAVSQLCQMRDNAGLPIPVIVSGCIGPRRDGYSAAQQMTVEEAKDYHTAQAQTFIGSDVDLISAYTINHVEEAIGIVLAVGTSGAHHEKGKKPCPCVISFTLETDGRLPSGQSLQDAITSCDEGAVAADVPPPVYYMLNCVHPIHFANVLEQAQTEGAAWVRRIKGIRANASSKSHAELDKATELDAGDPVELAAQLSAVMNNSPHINTLGGCCGTGLTHCREICKACVGSV